MRFQIQPEGMQFSTVIVISFHPVSQRILQAFYWVDFQLFVTKVDRVYHVQCFYMEADKTVSAPLEVSDLTTAFVTQLVPMPICRYEILNGGPTGAPIHYAIVGPQVCNYFNFIF